MNLRKQNKLRATLLVITLMLFLPIKNLAQGFSVIIIDNQGCANVEVDIPAVCSSTAVCMALPLLSIWSIWINGKMSYWCAYSPVENGLVEGAVIGLDTGIHGVGNAIVILNSFLPMGLFMQYMPCIGTYIESNFSMTWNCFDLAPPIIPGGGGCDPSVEACDCQADPSLCQTYGL
jgi:hypothetical protein